MSERGKKGDAAIDRFYRQVAKFLETRDWSVMVVGGARVTGRPPLKYNFTLSIDFTGAKREPKKKAKP
jgi:hypothetical protein